MRDLLYVYEIVRDDVRSQIRERDAEDETRPMLEMKYQYCTRFLN